MQRDNNEQYGKLIASWKEADTAVRQAQDALDAELEKFINEDGPVPTEAQRTAVRELRRVASDRLADVLSHLAKRAGPSSTANR
jgi:hypothetical protein